jgi:hypothetical protein
MGKEPIKNQNHQEREAFGAWSPPNRSHPGPNDGQNLEFLSGVYLLFKGHIEDTLQFFFNDVEGQTSLQAPETPGDWVIVSISGHIVFFSR